MNYQKSAVMSALDFVGALEAATGMAQPGAFLDPMTPESILKAFSRILVCRRPDRGLDILERTGVLKEVFPEVAALVGFGDSIRHKDVWLHTKQVIRQTPNRLVVRWGALLHDIGKVPTRKFTRDGQVTFIGHPEIGARMFENMAKRLPFPDKIQLEIRFLIAAHLRAAAYQNDWSDSAVRRFVKDTGPYLMDLLDLCRADITSKYEEKVRRGLRQINMLAARAAKIIDDDAKPKALPKGLGEALIKEFSIVPGKGLGDLMKVLTRVVESNELPAGAVYQTYIDHIRNHPELIALVTTR